MKNRNTQLHSHFLVSLVTQYTANLSPSLCGYLG